MKIKEWFSSHKPTKRRLIQLYAALLFNANLKGFGNGRIYRGPLKGICAPGINCYSCPAASAACPLGSLQNALTAANKSVPYYMVGIILLYALLLGRWICGFLCPFGLIQDLLYKIKTPKIKKNRLTKILSKLKYVILAVFVFALPLIYSFREFVLPAFCKYICPAGTLEGAVGLLSNPENENMFSMLGPLFTWKFFLLVIFILGAVFIYRFFCRFFCPLGLIYGLFNKISFIGVSVENSKCTECGHCLSVCKMDISKVGDTECIQCGDCISECPTNAIYRRGPRFLIDPGTPGGKIDEKTAKKNRLGQRIVAALLAVILCGALVYYNFIDKVPEAVTGAEVGQMCPDDEIPLYNSDQTFGFSVTTTNSKVRVINFWGTWCGPCVAELPHFDELASEFDGEAVFIAIHSSYAADTALDFVLANYPESKMLFGQGDDVDSYFYALGGGDTWPMTVVLDSEGIVTARFDGSVDYETLKAAIEDALD
ncbi:MAG: 4Fe-4S binding protein [Clostridia bacterium]|nr:4Fe-4S binding protein [Clostridia bacterium]